ncbi:MAG: sigma-70 family RNA polymerase sigma factor [Pseudomonadota bacterium]
MATKDANDRLDVYLKERKDLLSLARSIVYDAHVAEDLVQDSWLRWVKQDYPAREARPILKKIVSNLALDWYRRQQHEKRVAAVHAMHIEASPDSERVLIARQELGRVVRALSELPDRTVEAFRMSRVQGLKLAEIAARLNVSVPRAHQLVQQAIVHIAKHLLV